MQVEQGNLVIGFRIGGRDRLDNVTLAVLNELLGSGAGSALFRHVREERSLCYSIGSSTDRYKRCLFVQAGIDWDKAEEVEAAVLQEVDDLVNGAFTGEALEIARRGVYSGYRMGMDDPGSICAFGLGQELAGRRGSLRQSAALALEVTAEAVMELAARLQPALCYLLRGEARV